MSFLEDFINSCSRAVECLTTLLLIAYLLSAFYISINVSFAVAAYFTKSDFMMKALSSIYSNVLVVVSVFFVILFFYVNYRKKKIYKL